MLEPATDICLATPFAQPDGLNANCSLLTRTASCVVAGGDYANTAASPRIRPNSFATLDTSHWRRPLPSCWPISSCELSEFGLRVANSHALTTPRPRIRPAGFESARRRGDNMRRCHVWIGQCLLSGEPYGPRSMQIQTPKTRGLHSPAANNCWSSCREPLARARRGRGRAQMFRAEMGQRIIRRRQLEPDLREAISRN